MEMHGENVISFSVSYLDSDPRLVLTAQRSDQSLENGIFIKMHKWDKEDFIKDKEFYKELIKTYEKWQRNRGREGSVMEDLINL